MRFYFPLAPIQRAPQIRPEASVPLEPETPSKLPSALESVLSFKDLRAMEVCLSRTTTVHENFRSDLSSSMSAC